MGSSGRTKPGHTKILKNVNRNWDLDSKYHDDYPYLLLDHMKQGLSFEAFGGVVHVGTVTLYNWLEVHERFARAKDIGQSLCRIFWEQKGIEGMEKGKDFNAGVWMFNMKNRFSWHDEMKHLIAGSVDFNQKVDTKFLRNLMKRDPFITTPEEIDVTPSGQRAIASKES